jgi:hypothetical protein
LTPTAEQWAAMRPPPEPEVQAPVKVEPAKQ